MAIDRPFSNRPEGAFDAAGGLQSALRDIQDLAENPEPTSRCAATSGSPPSSSGDGQAIITAGYLRQLGATGVPIEVPDCAWVPTTSVTWTWGPAVFEGASIRIQCSVLFSEPFRWVTVTVDGDLLPNSYGPSDLPQ